MHTNEEDLFSLSFWLKRLKTYFFAVCSHSTWGKSLSLLLSLWMASAWSKYRALLWFLKSLYVSPLTEHISRLELQIHPCVWKMIRENELTTRFITLMLSLFTWLGSRSQSQQNTWSLSLSGDTEQTDANSEAEQGRWSGGKLVEGHTCWVWNLTVD